MAIQTRDLNLPTGETGNYCCITYLRFDKATRSLSAHFSLYKNATIRTTPRSQAQLAIVAKIRLEGDMFDKYFSSSALTTSGKNHIEQLYIAAKTEQDCVISDFHSAANPLFRDGIDV